MSKNYFLAGLLIFLLTAQAALGQWPVITRQNDSTLVSGSPTGNQWLLNGQAIAGATGPVLRLKQAGTYTLRVTNACGSAESEPERVQLVNGVAGAVADCIRIFPNPAGAQIRIESEGANVIRSVGVMDATGRQVYSVGPNAISCRIPTAGFRPGIYLVRISTGQKMIIRKVAVR